MSTRKLTASQLREFRGKIAKLKAKGLISKRVDARSVKPTSHMVSQVKKFGGVLTGKSAVVHAKKRAQAKEYSDHFAVKGKNVVVPVEKGERPRMNKKGDITSVRKVNGKRVKRLYTKSKDPSTFPTGPRIRYSIRMNWGGRNGRMTFDTFAELEQFMNTDSLRNFQTWENYVEIEEIDKRDMEDDESEDEE